MNYKQVTKRALLFKGLYRKSKVNIQEMFESQIDSDIQYSRARIISDLDEELKTLADKNDSWIRGNLKTAYMCGTTDVYEYLKKVGVTSIIFSKTDSTLLESKIDESLSFTHAIISGMRRSTSRILNETTTTIVQDMIANTRLSPYNLRMIKDQLISFFVKEGLPIKDTIGRNWNVEDYAEMFARTDMMNVYNQGVINQMLQNDWDLGKITSYPLCKCDICRAWEDKIVSITGKNKDYPALEEAYEDSVFHPNCRHRVRPYIE